MFEPLCPECKQELTQDNTVHRADGSTVCRTCWIRTNPCPSPEPPQFFEVLARYPTNPTLYQANPHWTAIQHFSCELFQHRVFDETTLKRLRDWLMTQYDGDQWASAELSDIAQKLKATTSATARDKAPPPTAAPEKSSFGTGKKKNPRTLEWLISTLKWYEELLATNATFTHAVSARSAEAASRLENQRDRFRVDAEIANAAGIDRIRLLCDELPNNDGCTAANVVKLWANVRRRTSCTQEEANALTLEEAADILDAARDNGVANGRTVSSPRTATSAESGDSVREEVFISYCHKDEKWLNALQVHLKPFLRNGSITAWSDKQIVPGSKWFDEIKAALARTKVAVLLVTPHFLASDFIHDHELIPLLKEAEDGGVRILSIPVRSSSYDKSALKDDQAIVAPDKPLADMKTGQRDRTWVRICKEIEKAVSAR